MDMPTIQARGNKLEISNLQLQMLIIYKSKILKCYCRGQILHINKSDDNAKCDIFAIDYGCVEKSISVRRIYHPQHKLNIPPLASHCQLADCKSKEEVWSSEVVDAMKYFVGEERAKIVVRGRTPDKLIVELINSCPDDIATMLALTGYTTLGYSQNIISRIPTLSKEKHYYTYKELKEGDTLHVRIQSGKDLHSFYVAQIDDYKKYIKERENLTWYSKEKHSLQPEDMKENKPISVFVSQLGRYERAIIKQITVPEDKALVQLVDWGSIIEADVSRMKPMSQIYFANPVIAIYCSAQQNQVWDNGLQRFLYPGYEFIIAIKKPGNQFDSPNIVKISPLSKFIK
ncbi:unnamed protein product [Parnassius apollo]|uniref:(apollo) hypothetical protein n=1 Tax=Parnassius apollo TaxID=110799 RepID=A0A8S3XM97_PARAO|nr:unnamed protein product [Parnassius apollo]